MKTCTRCGAVKRLAEFAKDKRIKSGLAAQCKRCMYEKTREWVAANRGRSNAYMREYNKRPSRKLYSRSWALSKKFGITHDDYLRLYEAQGGACAICNGPPNGKDPFFHVDHNHTTGRIRGLLCHLCNTGLGSMDDCPRILAAAIDYVRKHNGI